MIYKKYLIRDTDHFDPYNFPKLTEDLDTINVAMVAKPAAFNTDMLLSFLKDNSIRTEWTNANPQLAEMISSKSLPVEDLGAMFECCSKNPSFRKQLEEYIRSSFKTPSLS